MPNHLLAAQQVLKYLARYTHRVAISNRRLTALQDGHVSFSWRDYKRASQSAIMTLETAEFIRRFLLHVLPRGFVKIRHFGFLANRGRANNIQLCRVLLDARSPNMRGGLPVTQPLQADPSERCPLCKEGHLRPMEILMLRPRVLAGAGFRLPVPAMTGDTS